MTPGRWQQIKDIFDGALERSPSSRAAYIHESCGGDEDLRKEVESLLAADAETGQLNPLVQTTAGAPTAPFLGAAALPEYDSFGPYQPVRVLGEGGMGTVYLARQQQPIRREVALKVVKLGINSRQVLERFESERQALALMDYPHVARVLDAGTSERGRPYFVMEYVDGVPITQYCDAKSLNTRARLQLFVPVCNALQHAHKKGIIHRDVKPSNVLVTEVDGKPVPKVIDFGIARATDQRSMEFEAFTLAGQIIGTPEYMSPEQADTDSHDIDTGTDVYSLGVVLYELLVGALPLDLKAVRKMAFAEVLRMIREAPVPKPTARITQMGAAADALARRRSTDPSQLKRDLSGDLDWIVMKAIDKDRYCRYSSASEFAADIERYLKNEPVLAGPPGAVYRMRKFVRRHKTAVGAAGLLSVLLTAFTVTTAIQSARIGRALEKADRERIRAEQVSNFLVGLFKTPDPAEARGNAITAREILDKGAQRIATELKTQLEVQATLLDTIGKVYRNLGLYPESQKYLERSLELRRQMLGERDPVTLASLFALGDLYIQQGRYAEAEPLMTKLVQSRAGVLGETHPETLKAMSSLGFLYGQQGKYPDAEELLNKVLKIRRATLGAQHVDTGSTVSDLAFVYRNDGKYQQSEALYKEAVAITRRTLGEDHPDTVISMRGLGQVYIIEGKYPQAEELLTRVVESSRRVLGEEHPDTLVNMHELALLYRNEGKYSQAEILFTKTLEAQRRVLGVDHPHTLFTMGNLAALYRNEGKYSQAEELYTKVVDGRRRTLGEEHPDTLFSLNSMATTYWSEGKYGQAEALFSKVAESRRRVLGEDHPDRLNTLALLGRVRLQEKRYSEAEAAFRDALRGYEKTRPDAWERYGSEGLLGMSLAGQRKYSEAEPLLLSGYEGMVKREATIAAGSRSVLKETTAALAKLYQDWGKPGKAVEWQAKVRPK